MGRQADRNRGIQRGTNTQTDTDRVTSRKGRIGRQTGRQIHKEREE